MIEAPLSPDEPRRLRALRELGVLYTPAEERFDRITRLATRLFGAPISLVSLVAEHTQWFKSAQGLEVSETPRRVAFCAHAILGDGTMVVPNALDDERFLDNPLVTGAPSIRFYAGHPLHAEDGSKLGTLCVIDTKPRMLSPTDLAALSDLAAIAESELKLASVIDARTSLLQEIGELTRKAMLDSLTRLWNRQGIMEILERELQRARRTRLPVCLALADIDHFKKINDTYGHVQGDLALVEVALRMRASARAYDAIGRYGGKEFLVVISDCDQATALRTAERMRVQVAGADIDSARLPERVTLSVGVVCSHGHPEVSAEQLIQAADEALYAAKRAGRDRVVLGKL